MQWLRFFPESATSTAGEVDSLAWGLLAICAVFSLGIALAITFFAIRYWHPRDVNRRVNESRRLHWCVELTWMLMPLAILIVMFYWGARVFVRAHRPPAEAMEVHVVAKQWMWKLGHDDGAREINTLHVPAGRPVQLTMISEDVIHSFFVPAFRVKRDVLPGRYSTLWFEATQPGTYHLFCAEYCGTNHSRMVGEVVVEPPAMYARWLARRDESTPTQRGRRHLDALKCWQCHGREHDKRRAPPLPGLFGRRVPLADGTFREVDAAYIRQSILDPAAHVHAGYHPVMPSFEGEVDELQIAEIIAYLRSVADATGPIAGPGGETESARRAGK